MTVIVLMFKPVGDVGVERAKGDRGKTSKTLLEYSFIQTASISKPTITGRLDLEVCWISRLIATKLINVRDWQGPSSFGDHLT
jgi:hypothetical protein